MGYRNVGTAFSLTSDVVCVCVCVNSVPRCAKLGVCRVLLCRVHDRWRVFLAAIRVCRHLGTLQRRKRWPRRRMGRRRRPQEFCRQAERTSAGAAAECPRAHKKRAIDAQVDPRDVYQGQEQTSTAALEKVLQSDRNGTFVNGDPVFDLPRLALDEYPAHPEREAVTGKCASFAVDAEQLWERNMD